MKSPTNKSEPNPEEKSTGNVRNFQMTLEMTIFQVLGVKTLGAYIYIYICSKK